LTQVPPQLVRPAPQVTGLLQTPPLQLPPPQLCPQAPQLLLSLARFAQPLGQATVPCGQEAAAQAPL
jgi:hypothetical protein